MDHVKPTKEELEANAQKALEEAEKLKEQEEHEEATSESSDHKESDGDEKESENNETDDETGRSESSDEEEDVKVKDLEETKRKLEEKNKYSAQEAIILHSTNKKIQESIEQAADMPIPTDEEMKKIYSNWEDLDEFSQKMARDSEWNSRKIQAVTSVSQEFKDYNAWKTKVDDYISDPTTITNTPLLDGREEAFKTFAMKPTRRGVDFEDLVRSFLYGVSDKPVNKGKMLDTSSSKSKESKTPGKLSAEQGRALRENDYKKWVELSRKGMIESAV